MLKVSARLFPIGYIISVDAPNFDPHDFYIDGNWERIKGRVIVGVDEAQTEFNTTGKTGGAKTHTLTRAQMPSHTHIQNPHNHTINYIANQNSSGHPTVTHRGEAAMHHRGFIQNTTATNQNTGGGGAHNNLQPYQTAYVWKLISYSN